MKVVILTRALKMSERVKGILNAQYRVHDMRNVAVLTYNQKHRKTYDTLCLLKANGYQNVKIYAQPMTYTKKHMPLINHRPVQNMLIPEPKELCSNFGYEYIEGDFNSKITDNSAIYLLCGAGLLEKEFVRSHQIINAHPGYIPLARGLDAYKWSIYYDFPIGVTTHFLGDYIDAGEIIEQRELKVGKYDTFHAVAQRVYENEIDMLVGAIELADKQHEFVMPKSNDVFRRMPNNLEETLLEVFENYKEKHLEEG